MAKPSEQTEQGTEQGTEQAEGSIDYEGSQAEIDKAKQKARDDDAERLRRESA